MNKQMANKLALIIIAVLVAEPIGIGLTNMESQA